MFKFSDRSKRNLNECHAHLRILFNEVIKHWDCAIVCGFRGEEDQNKAFNEGKSTKRWPESRHNKFPSYAVDVYPCVNGKITDDKVTCYAFGGFVLGIATMLQLPLTWGGDWDCDRDLHDQNLYDLVHFELKGVSI